LLAFGILMARLSWCPMHLPMPSKARIAPMCAPYAADLQSVVFQAADGFELHAWYRCAGTSNGQAVILLHGIGDNRGGVAGYGQAFLRQSYRILLPDSRAHGESGGAVATYGLRESDDIHHWVSWLSGKGASYVDGLGESMGALMLESLRSYFRSVAYDREGYFVGAGRFDMERMVGRTVDSCLPSLDFSMLDGAMAWICGGPIPLDAVRSSTVPLRLIHGEQDTIFCLGTRALWLGLT
jgi:hypothetical protein